MCGHDSTASRWIYAEFEQDPRPEALRPPGLDSPVRALTKLFGQQAACPVLCASACGDVEDLEAPSSGTHTSCRSWPCSLSLSLSLF
jgi:hypothetical protein